jgi:SAM-dependent methyltransferase
MAEKREYKTMNKSHVKPIQLYSNKAVIYAKHRPDYAPEAFAAFQKITKLVRNSIVADVGSGTGMLTRHLLNHYNTVYAIEPTPEMRKLAEDLLGNQINFHSLDGRAENIPLPDNSVHLIAVGQAIHWFQPEKTLAEFQRIAKHRTWLLLTRINSLDNELNKAVKAIFTEENGLLHSSKQPPSNLVPLGYYFADGRFEVLHFPHSRLESWEGFLGGIGSAAYAPDKDHPLYPKFVQATRKVFNQFNQNGVKTWNIATEISYGYLAQ